MTLDQIAIKHGTDKSSKHHGYCEIYERYFESKRDNKILLLEIGWGAYWHIDQGGAGARMWRDYFAGEGRTYHPETKIVSIDSYPKNIRPSDHLIKFYQCNQDDKNKLEEIILIEGNPNIIIDDGSHHCDLTILSFEYLWPHLQRGGAYVIEDSHTTYWEIASDEQDFKGGIDNPNSTLNYFKRMLDKVMHNSGVHDPSIESIHFYDKLIFIFKK